MKTALVCASLTVLAACGHASEVEKDQDNMGKAYKRAWIECYQQYDQYSSKFERCVDDKRTTYYLQLQEKRTSK
jgi:hypothetical protein